MAELPLLPLEIFDLILPFLTQKDIKSLRLTCRPLAAIGVRYVFQRVRMSFLKADRDAFFKISEASHLRFAVKQLVWHELDLKVPQDDDSIAEYASKVWPPEKLPLDVMEAHEVSNANIKKIEACGAELANPDFYPFVEDFLKSYRQSLWWSRKPNLTYEEVKELFIGETREFSKAMVTALKNMPNIHTIISRAMPPERPLGISSYPFTAGLIRRESFTSPSNFGLMITLDAVKSSGLAIKHLFWSDFGSVSSTLLLDSSHRPAFKFLRHIDLCLSDLHPYQNFPQSVDNLALCLGTASGLQSLKICFESRAPPHREKKFERQVFQAFFLLRCWSRLERLELVDVFINLRDLLEFLENHAKSLRHLALDGCSLWADEQSLVRGADVFPNVRPSAGHPDFSAVFSPVFPSNWNALLRGMAAMKTLHLRSLHVFPRDKSAYILVSEDAALKFINDGDERSLRESWDSTCTGCSIRNPHYDLAIDNARDFEDSHDVEQNSDKDDDAESDAGWTVPETVYWHLKRRYGEDIKYWSTPEPSKKAYETQQWLFRRQNSQYGYGTDPLDFFEDWDSDAGDVAEPSPFGLNFKEFVHGHIPGAVVRVLDRQGEETVEQLPPYDFNEYTMEAESEEWSSASEWENYWSSENEDEADGGPAVLEV